MASKQGGCIPIIIMVVLITTIVEDVHGLFWWRGKRDTGKDNLALPCGIEKFDANSDGYLDLEEFATAAKVDSSDPNLIAHFARYDKNGDLKLSIDEQIKAMPSRCIEKEIEAIKEKAEKAGDST